jgi:hypothetical protein
LSELALIKVAGKGEKRVEALRLAEAFRADVIDPRPVDISRSRSPRAVEDRRVHQRRCSRSVGQVAPPAAISRGPDR